MNKETHIEEILNQLIDKGTISDLKILKEKSLDLIKKDIDLSEALAFIAKDIKNETSKFLNSKNIYDTNYISGISTCVYLPDFKDSGEYKLKIVGGNTARTKSSLKIDEHTLFDISDITKLYTLVLLFKLEELNLIKLDVPISLLNPNYNNLDNITINDLLNLNIDLVTKGNINNITTKEEAYEILKSALAIETKENKNTDLKYIIISDTIKKVIEEKLKEKLSFEEIMHQYLIQPSNLYQTQFNPLITNVTANGNKKRLVFDNKTKILGGALGNAGIFTTSDDLASLSKKLYRVNYRSKGLINKNHLINVGKIFKSDIKHLSLDSFSIKSYNGCYATFDPNNLIHSNILLNSIYDGENVYKNKPIGFEHTFSNYKNSVIENIMIMYVAKKYYNKYCNIKENIEVTKYI